MSEKSPRARRHRGRERPPPPFRARRGSRWLALAIGLASIAPFPARGDVRPLTLYQKTARASLVAKVRATSDTTRRPPLEVIEVFKGAYAGKTLYIVPFIQDYGNPKPWLQREVFRKGEEYFLFLDPYDRNRDDDAFPEAGEKAERSPEEDEEEKTKTLFVVLNANQGVISVPAEGGDAIADALKRFSAILAMGQYDRQAVALRGLLVEKNPYMIEAGLGETRRYHLATPEDLDALVALLTSPRDEFRSGAAELLGDLTGRMRSAGTPLQRQEEILELLGGVARTDREPKVRVAGVRAVARVGGKNAEALLEAIAREDSSQDVRYAAQVALVEISGESMAPGPRRGGSEAP